MSANTGGRGVDVVLNSLSGAFQAASLQALTAAVILVVAVGRRLSSPRSATLGASL